MTYRSHVFSRSEAWLNVLQFEAQRRIGVRAPSGVGMIGVPNVPENVTFARVSLPTLNSRHFDDSPILLPSLKG